MDNPNLNPSAPETPKARETDMKFPSYESIQKESTKQSPHFLVAIIAIITVGMGLLWYYLSMDFDYAPTQLKLSGDRKQTNSVVDELSNINVGDLDSEFQSVDSDLNSL